MAETCNDCTCATAADLPATGRVILATEVDHTAYQLRSIALRGGSQLRVLAPGLLEVHGDDRHGFLASLCDQLTSVESREVRCLTAPDTLTGNNLLRQAMRAPALDQASARLAHADLLPLFANELSAFHSVYQPIVQLSDEAVVGHEALLRATDASGATVMPDVLFPAAEAAGWTGLLDRIGRTTALRHAAPWLGAQHLYINFVASSIYRPEICLRTTEQAAAEGGLSMDQLVFEVTENHLVRDVAHLEAVFAYYRDRGCRVALDDLGAGYSSLNLLLRLRPEVVKLDKEIVQGLPDPISVATVSAIVSITHSYGGLVLAECVETVDQSEDVRRLGVDLGQGWFYGAPVRPAANGMACSNNVEATLAD